MATERVHLPCKGSRFQTSGRTRVTCHIFNACAKERAGEVVGGEGVGGTLAETELTAENT